jgi:hypothetical protein
VAARLFKVLVKFEGKYLVRKNRTIQQCRNEGYLLVYMDETWVYSGMTHKRDWLDPIVEDNPSAARRFFRTVGPTPAQSRGKRAIVIGSICQDGIIQESMEILISGKTTGYF